MKKSIIFIILGLIIFFCFLIGIYMSKIINIENIEEVKIAEITDIEDECTAEYEYFESSKSANANEKKLSPDAVIIINTYYEECGHTITQENKVNREYINKTKEELEDIFKDYEIKEFSNDKVVLDKKEKGVCNEHYIVKDKDGYVAVYNLDEYENENLQQVTEIATSFLTTNDIEKLQSGVWIYGRENLNKLLEDLE